MSLELVYGYEASNLFLTDIHTLEMLRNPGHLALAGGGKLRDSNLIYSILISVYNFYVLS